MTSVCDECTHISRFGTKSGLRSSVWPESKWPGDDTPDRASWSTRSMSDNESSDDSSDGVECPTCGSLFDSSHELKRHHTMVHGGPLCRVDVVCDYCGSDTDVSVSDYVRNDHFFCGRVCFGKWRSANLVGEDAPNWKGGSTVQCDWCGEEKEVYPCDLEQDNHFCNRECKGNWMSENMTGPNSPSWDDISVECSWCGSQKDISESRVRDGNYFCDTQCHGEWRTENLVGEDAPNWRGGRSPIDYGPGWNEETREQVRERDGRECQNCGRSEEDHIALMGRKHSVHHIQKARSFDDPEKRNHPDNLITLCHTKECHMRWEKMSPLRPQVGGGD